MDTLEHLQEQLASLKRRYENGARSDARDEDFAQEEAALVDRFRAIGHAPSYPDGFLESRQKERGAL